MGRGMGRGMEREGGVVRWPAGAATDLAACVTGNRDFMAEDLPKTDTVVPKVLGGGLALAAVLLVALVLWIVRDVLLLGFGAVLVAILLSAGAERVQKLLPVGWSLALAITLALLVGVTAGATVLLGGQTVAELSELWNQVPAILETLDQRVDLGVIEDWIAGRVGNAVEAESVVYGISGMTMIVFGTVGGILLVLAGGFFLALDPRSYRGAFLRLFPVNMRREARECMDAVALSLRFWLVGQLIAMVAVAVLTTAGLLMLGVSTAIALGAIAGLLEFIPYAGPIMSAVPAIAVALTDSPQTALWVALLYLAIQQVEGIVLLPLIQRQTVDLPPALTILSVVAFGILLGPLGVILAAPLTVAAATLIRVLWQPRADQIGREILRSESEK